MQQAVGDLPLYGAHEAEAEAADDHFLPVGGMLHAHERLLDKQDVSLPRGLLARQQPRRRHVSAAGGHTTTHTRAYIE